MTNNISSLRHHQATPSKAIYNNRSRSPNAAATTPAAAAAAAPTDGEANKVDTDDKVGAAAPCGSGEPSIPKMDPVAVVRNEESVSSSCSSGGANCESRAFRRALKKSNCSVKRARRERMGGSVTAATAPAALNASLPPEHDASDAATETIPLVSRVVPQEVSEFLVVQRAASLKVRGGGGSQQRNSGNIKTEGYRQFLLPTTTSVSQYSLNPTFRVDSDISSDPGQQTLETDGQVKNNNNVLASGTGNPGLCPETKKRCISIRSLKPLIFRSSGSPGAASTAAGAAPGGSRAGSARLKGSDDHLAIIFMGIILIFLVCHLPRIILDIVERITIHKTLLCHAARRQQHSMLVLLTTSVSHMLLVLNSATNMVVYCIVSPKFRVECVHNSRKYTKRLASAFTGSGGVAWVRSVASRRRKKRNNKRRSVAVPTDEHNLESVAIQEDEEAHTLN